MAFFVPLLEIMPDARNPCVTYGGGVAIITVRGETSMRDISKNIKEIRERKNMTQTELAEKLFVTRQTISNYETGRTRPDIEMLVKLADALNIDVNHILYGTPDWQKRALDIKKTYLLVACVGILFGLDGLLSGWALEIKREQYDALPMLFVTILYRPMVAGLAGWSVLQGLSVVTKLPVLTDGKKKLIQYGTISVLMAYIIIMTPLLWEGVFKVRLDIPSYWRKICYFALGTLPTQYGNYGYLLVMLVLGATLRILVRTGKNE